MSEEIKQDIEIEVHDKEEKPEVAQTMVGEEQPKEEAPKKKKKEKSNKELEKALAEKEEYMNALIRERADFENFKKRNSLAVSKAYADGKIEAATALLPVIDNLERAIAAAEESPMKTGVEMVLRQLIDAFGAMEIEEIPADGAPFDPNLHNAVMQVPAEEGEESGIIKEVLMKGYQSADRVLRHSMVKVTE